MIRTRLGLTDKEMMNKSWIALNLELVDFPSYDYDEEEEPGSIEEQKASIQKLVKRTSHAADNMGTRN